jgi:hypothetical protein
MTRRLRLGTVTLCCIDTRHTAQAQQALLACMAQADFAEVLFFCTPEAAATNKATPGIRHIGIPPLRNIQDYSRFMLKELGKHVHSEHALCIQWDGFITHPALWDEHFLQWDYIGAPWVYKNRPSEVGNGGFSLRSRALLQATMALAWDDQEPEDAAICRTLRPQLESQFGLKFASLDIAERFSHEYGSPKETFGFHGMHNFAHRMSADDLSGWIRSAPNELLTHWHARNLIKQLISQGRGREARDLIQKRRSIRGWQVDDLGLWLRSCRR